MEQLPETQLSTSSSSSSSSSSPSSSSSSPSDVVTFHTAQGSHLERVGGEVGEVCRHSFEVAKFERDHLCPIPFDRGREVIVLAGHSLGGAASVIAARRDPDISACINLDGGLRGDKPTEPLSTPLLQIFSDHGEHMSPEDEQIQKEHRELQDHSENAQMTTIVGTGHMDFSVNPLLQWLLGEKTLDSAFKAHRVASRAMVQFMNDWCRLQTNK